VTIRCAPAPAVGVMIGSSRVMNRSSSAVMIGCAHAAGPRDDPSLTFGRTCDDPLRSRWPGRRDDPAVTRPPAGG
jgi:hypothetical protein